MHTVHPPAPVANPPPKAATPSSSPAFFRLVIPGEPVVLLVVGVALALLDGILVQRPDVHAAVRPAPAATAAPAAFPAAVGRVYAAAAPASVVNEAWKRNLELG